MSMEQKYYSVKEIAQIFGLKPAIVRDYCHAKGQRFAFQPVKNGNIYIDPQKFEKWFNFYQIEGGARR
jgi:predicted transcriptional regulator